MTTNEAPLMATADAPDTPAPRTSDDEPAVGSHDSAAESTGGDTALRGEPRPDVARDDPAAQAGSLIAPERGVDYRARWSAVQGDFIDEPRKAVTDADTLVGEVLDDLAETFRGQRQTLEQQWADDESTTEDLRIALRLYRTFFHRLLSL